MRMEDGQDGLPTYFSNTREMGGDLGTRDEA